MANNVIRPQELGKFIEDAIQEYKEEVDSVIEESFPNVGKETVKQLKKTSPKNTGKYAKGWKSKVDKDRLGQKLIVYNKDHYQLTHLLEKGHAKVNGGRVPGQPHIKPAEDYAVDKVVKNITDKLER